ncbi:MAG: hypothetical protein ABIR94_03840 [Rubrivivax sp.]
MWRRQLLIILIALALPLQAYAAASMLWCGPVHPSRVVQSQGEHHARSAHEHGSGASSSEAHVPHHADGPVDASGAQPQSDTGSSKCSLCAVCSVGVALLPTVQMLGVSATPASVVLQPARLPAAFLTGGIERPPRAVLA